MRKSEKIGEIAASLAKAQGSFKNCIKNKQGQSGTKTYGYSDIAAIWDSIRDALSENDLTILQDVTVSESTVFVETTIVHSSDQWITFGPISMPVTPKPKKFDSDHVPASLTAQDFGSAISYAKRYAISACIGINSEDADDDGEAASTDKSQQKTHFTNGKISESQLKYLTSLLAGQPMDTAEKMSIHYKVKGIEDLSAAQASEAINTLKTKAAK